MSYISLRQEPIISRRINSMPPSCFPHLSAFTGKENEIDLRSEFSPELEQICSSTNLPEIPLCKIIVLGDVAVGKTSLVKRFSEHTFNNEYKATIGVDFQVARFNVLSIPFHLQIWDTAGQERFKCIAQAYYRKAHVIMLVFDMTNLATLSNCAVWYEEAMRFNYDDPLIFLIGTKIDKMGSSEIDKATKSGFVLARDLGAEFWTVSSSTGQRIEALMRRTAAISFQYLILSQKKVPKKKIVVGSDVRGK
ncbi:ras-related protein Rab-36-like [Ctenocephalides felis]|uniref:ras-related protein Rab-36-like n=1 Tax=Ctenocephalides felis TaxID=7515 RepID=UPI000E6E4C4E|nr:ras-related protein Rab-36-like [Ctenocephalides felis]